MVIERFKSDLAEVRERFKLMGRLLPDEVDYLGSWLTNDGRVCYQVMRCDTIEQLDPWIDKWSDLVHFERFPVVESSEFWAAWDRDKLPNF